MRLIDADALKRRAITVRFFGKDIMMVPTSEIDDAPTIEAEQGEWIEKYNGNGWNDFWDYTCSNCGKKYERANVLYHANYCPNCGAKMKGGDSE